MVSESPFSSVSDSVVSSDIPRSGLTGPSLLSLTGTYTLTKEESLVSVSHKGWSQLVVQRAGPFLSEYVLEYSRRDSPTAKINRVFMFLTISHVLRIPNGSVE